MSVSACGHGHPRDTVDHAPTTARSTGAAVTSPPRYRWSVRRTHPAPARRKRALTLMNTARPTNAPAAAHHLGSSLSCHRSSAQTTAVARKRRYQLGIAAV